jgi:hypothetical protein
MEVYDMKELFKQVYIEAEERLHKNGYYVDNMLFDENCFEVSDESGKVLIDYLSMAQLVQLSKMLSV